MRALGHSTRPSRLDPFRALGANHSACDISANGSSVTPDRPHTSLNSFRAASRTPPASAARQLCTRRLAATSLSLALDATHMTADSISRREVGNKNELSFQMCANQVLGLLLWASSAIRRKETQPNKV